MSARPADPHQLGHGEVPISERGPAPLHIVVAYGFWIFLLSDFILFSGFFASYAVLVGATAGGPSGRDIFDLPLVAWETAALLLSSFAAGMASVAMLAKNTRWFQVGMAVAAILGVLFLCGEVYEFAHLIGEGNGPDRSAFLSSFFTLVGTHGLHVTFGVIWLVVLMVQVQMKGLIPANRRRLMCLSLFWHFLDVIWIGVFTFVYLMGMLR